MPRKKPEQPTDKQVQTFNIVITRNELIHLRDLFSTILPGDNNTTVSQALALTEGREIVENMLWKKVSQACASANLPLDDSAPDYVVASVGQPSMAVFQIDSNGQGDRTTPVAGVFSAISGSLGNTKSEDK